MTTYPSCRARRSPSCAGHGTALVLGAVNHAWRSALLVAASVYLVACAALPTARMALPAGLGAVEPLPFEGLGAGRSGRFTIDGQVVTFRRTGDSLSVLERLRIDRVSLEFEHRDARARCDGRATAIEVGIVDTPARPLALSCRFTGPVPGELQLFEPRLAGAGTRQAREGAASFGGVVIDIRSEHALTGSPWPLPQPAGYRLMMHGRDVAALDLASGTPTLRSTTGLDPGVRAAVIQVSLTLGLLFDSAVTLG